MKRLKAILVSVIAASLLAGACLPAPARAAQPAPVPDSLKPGFETITEADAGDLARMLSGANFGARLTGSAGHLLAAGYAMALFERWGLEPAGDDGTFFQRLPARAYAVDADGSTLTALSGAVKGRYAVDWTHGVSVPRQPLKLTGPATFVNVTDPGAFQTQAGAFKGAIVILRLAEGIPPGVRHTIRQALRDAGAALIFDMLEAEQGEESAAGGVSMWEVPGLATAGDSAAGALQAGMYAGFALRLAVSLRAPRFMSGTANSVEKRANLTLDTRLRERAVETVNVLARLPGRDPAGRTIVVGAHLDRFGAAYAGDAGGAPGGDDNAGGATALLLAARALASNPAKPESAILFALWTGEARGTLGSDWFGQAPTVPFRRIAGAIALDGIGRGAAETEPGAPRSVSVAGPSLPKGQRAADLAAIQAFDALPKNALWQAAERANASLGLAFSPGSAAGFASTDTRAFVDRGVPALAIMAGDGSLGIDGAAVRDVARLVYMTAHEAGK